MLSVLGSIYDDVGKCILTLILSEMVSIESVKQTLGAKSKSSVTK